MLIRTTRIKNQNTLPRVLFDAAYCFISAHLSSSGSDSKPRISLLGLRNNMQCILGVTCESVVAGAHNRD
jgi:hypothetical protein